MTLAALALALWTLSRIIQSITWLSWVENCVARVSVFECSSMFTMFAMSTTKYCFLIKVSYYRGTFIQNFDQNIWKKLKFWKLKIIKIHFMPFGAWCERHSCNSFTGLSIGGVQKLNSKCSGTHNLWGNSKFSNDSRTRSAIRFIDQWKEWANSIGMQNDELGL